MKLGRVWVALGVAIGVMHAMQDRVGARMQKTRALAQVREQMEEALPARAHGELTMCTIAVQIERLAEHREVPVQEEEQSNRHGFIQAGVGRDRPLVNLG